MAIPLHEIAHPLVSSTAERFAGAVLPASAKRFRSVRDHDWYESAHGERWRGLVHRGATGQIWLCFAGWHEKDAVDDVFKRFTMACTVGGTTVDSTSFLPSLLDSKRLEAEDLYKTRELAAHELRCRIIAGLLAAATSSGEEHSVDLRDGSKARIVLLEDVDEDFDELRLRISVNWEGDAGYAILNELKDSVPGIAATEWSDIPPGPDGQDPGFYAYLDHLWVAGLIAAAAEHGVPALSQDPTLVLDPADGLAHVVIRNQVAGAYIEGAILRSACGRRFVPSRDPDSTEVCPRCQTFQDAVTHVRGDHGIA